MDKTPEDALRPAYWDVMGRGHLLVLSDDSQIIEALITEGLAALGANGYVVVPRHLLDELIAVGEASAAVAMTAGLDRNDWIRARAAVVEAVGPTREDTKP